MLFSHINVKLSEGTFCHVEVHIPGVKELTKLGEELIFLVFLDLFVHEHLSSVVHLLFL